MTARHFAAVVVVLYIIFSHYTSNWPQVVKQKADVDAYVWLNMGPF